MYRSPLKTKCDGILRYVLNLPRCSQRRLHSKSAIKIAELLHAPERFVGDEKGAVTVQGLIRSVRKQKRVAFAVIGDGTTWRSVQAILDPKLAEGLSTGAAVRVSGSWVTCPQGAQQTHELQASDVELLGNHEAESYPLQKKYHSNDFLRTIPHLRLRTAQNALMLRARSQMVGDVYRFFDNEDFVNVHPPVITSSDCEGAGEVFAISPASSDKSSKYDDHFFCGRKYLTVSSQLHLEAFAASVGRVWTLAPTFRAEQSDTPRHLSEFYMLEAEEMFTEDVEAVMQTVERLIVHLASQLSSSRLSNELLEAVDSRQKEAQEDAISSKQLKDRWQKLASSNWPRITYTDAISHLKQAMQHENFKHEPTWDAGLQAEHEKYLAKTIGNDGPLFVTHYPQKLKAFYMAVSPADQQVSHGNGPTVACFDLIVPDLCEIAGGSIREHRLEALQNQAAGGQMAQHLQWYMDLRRYGSAPHGGFGLGFDRLLCYLTGTNSVREMVAFPRWYGRCDC